MPNPAPSPVSSEPITVPYPRVTGLVRQLTHDVRNGLNNVDLQAAYLQELVVDPQVVPEIKRLRGMVTETARMLQAFSATFWLPTPNVVTYSAQMFFEDFRQRLGKLLPELAPEIRWTIGLGEEPISVDLEMFSRGLAEYFKNALQFREGSGSIEARIGARKGELIVELIEDKSAVASDPETWGREPLVSTRRGGFGMGLFFARQVLDLHGGTVSAIHEPTAKRLTTRLTLPLAAA